MKRILLILLILFTQVSYILAGPGGKIAKEFFQSPLSKVFAVLLAIIFLPLILRNLYRRYKNKKAAKEILSKLAKIDADKFDELALNNRVTDVFRRVHTAWSNEDLEECADFMSSWYQQNQQMVFLNEWKKKGLKNICTIDKIESIEPIHIRVSNKDNFDGTRIIYAISANLEDYLMSVKDSSIIEGEKGFRSVETIWTVILDKGIWKVDNIEQSEMLSKYLKMENLVPDNLFEIKGQKLA